MRCRVICKNDIMRDFFVIFSGPSTNHRKPPRCGRREWMPIFAFTLEEEVVHFAGNVVAETEDATAALPLAEVKAR